MEWSGGGGGSGQGTRGGPVEGPGERKKNKKGEGGEDIHQAASFKTLQFHLPSLAQRSRDTGANVIKGRGIGASRAMEGSLKTACNSVLKLILAEKLL